MGNTVEWENFSVEKFHKTCIATKFKCMEFFYYVYYKHVAMHVVMYIAYFIYEFENLSMILY